MGLAFGDKGSKPPCESRRRRAAMSQQQALDGLAGQSLFAELCFPCQLGKLASCFIIE